MVLPHRRKKDKTGQMRRYKQRQTKKLLQFKQKYPKIFKEVFGELSIASEHVKRQPKKKKTMKRRK